MSYKSRALLFAGFGAFTFFLFLGSENFIVGLLAIAAAALALMLLYRPETNRIFLRHRSPTSRDWALFAIMSLQAIFVLLFISAFFEFFSQMDVKNPADRQNFVKNLINTALYVLAFASMCLPMARQAFLGLKNPDQDPPVWPIAVGLGGGAMIGIAVFLLTINFDSLKAYNFHAKDGHLQAVMFIVLASFFYGPGISLWWRAFSAGEHEQFTKKGVFVATQNSIRYSMIISVVIAAVLALWHDGPVSDVPAMLPVALVAIVQWFWIVTIARLPSIDPNSSWRAVAAIAVMIVAYPISIGIPASLSGSGVYWPLFLIIVLPVTCAVAAFVYFVMPKILRGILQTG